jgi:LysM repeat protein
LITEREKLEFESLPEFVREPRPARDTYVNVAKAAPVEEPGEQAIALPKSAELEALWPGVNHDVFHVGPKKGPSFYLSIGFAVGAVVSWIGVWAFSSISHNMASTPTQTKEIVVAQGKTAGAHQAAGAGTVSGDGQLGTIAPASPVYEVATGDTLAGIALKNYHRATPRLLDEICRANNMSNANVLNLGQKLNLPEYHPQQIAEPSSAARVQ